MNPNLQEITPSLTLALSATAKQLLSQGKDVINLSAGEPDFATPDFVKDRIKEALDRNFTKYTPALGLRELRESVSYDLREKGLDYSWEETAIFTGAKYALYSALYALLDQKDKVLIISPYWVSYVPMAKLCGAQVVVFETGIEDNFEPDFGKLVELLDPQVKAVIINSPSNPTGKVYSPEFLNKLLEICLERNIYIINDQIYDRIVFDGKKLVSLHSLNPGAKKIVITVDGASKSLAMTGLRIGWLAARLEIIKNIAKFVSHTTSCAVSICQYALAQALKDNRKYSFFSALEREYQDRRDVFCSKLKELFSSRIRFYKPDGAFYVFLDIRDIASDSLDFAKKFLESKFVACVPGEPFGKKGFLRVSLTQPKERLVEALLRLKDFLESYAQDNR